MVENIKNALSEYKSRKGYAFAAFLVLLILIALSYFFLKGFWGKTQETSQINEPEVPLSQDVNTDVLGERTVNQTTSTPTVTQTDSTSNNNSNTGSNNNSNTGNQNANRPQSTATPTPTQGPSVVIADLGSVVKAKKSKSGESMVVLTKESEQTQSAIPFIPQVNAQTVNEGAFTLSITDNKGNVIETLERNKVIDADFIEDDYVYYQAIGSGAGIYRYDRKNKQKNVMIYTYDTRSFGNVVPVDNENYFFIQPTTGKIGFGKLNSTEFTVLDEKILSVNSNYVKASAYRFASVSPDKKFVAVYDLDADQDLKVAVKIFPVNAKKKDDIYYETKVSYPGGGFKDTDNIFRWSNDGKYLAAGNNGVVIDINKKSAFYTGDEKTISKVAPNMEKIVAYDQEVGKAVVKDLKKNTSYTLPEGVVDVEWMNNDYLIVVIGQRLYVFNTANNDLKSVMEKRVPFEILESDTDNGRVMVRGGDTLYEINKK
jgi:hypothetical protein